MSEDEAFSIEYNLPEDLQPVNDQTRELVERGKTHLEQLLKEANAFQEKSNRIKKSRFNPHNLYCAFGYSQRCTEDGTPDENGGFFRGVELTLSSTVENVGDCATIDYVDGQFLAHLGRRVGEEAQGLLVNTQDRYNKTRLERPIVGGLKLKGFKPELTPVSDTETLVLASKGCKTALDALKASDAMVSVYLSKVGLEGKVYNLIEQRPNVVEITDENMGAYIKMDDEPRDSYGDIVIVTATRICRRCTSEFDWLFRGVTQHFPDILFGIAFVDKPKLRFMPKVLDQDCGDVRTSGKVTPFIIVYKQGEFCEYTATKKVEHPPDEETVLAMMRRHLDM